MKFGVFFEISVPRPWSRESNRQVYENCLEQVRLADELGFDYVWAVEHHFEEELSHCSAPELFLTACAMQTKRIRVGHGIAVCVPQINHPIRLAERAAVLDILSGGRLDFGTGRAGTWLELSGFQVNPDDTKKTWDEYVRVIPKMWTQERFSYQGQCFSMPERAVVPKPYQEPHPPMWVAVSSPGTELDAAERGLGALGLSFGGFAEQERKVKRYRERIRNCDPVGEVVNDQISTVSFLFCHEDDDYAIQTGRRFSGYVLYNTSQFLSIGETVTSRYYVAGPGLLPQFSPEATAPGEAKALPDGLTFGDPHRVTEILKGWESTGVDCVNFILNCLETVPQQEVLESLRLFAREVMPKFKDRPATNAQTTGKREVRS